MELFSPKAWATLEVMFKNLKTSIVQFNSFIKAQHGSPLLRLHIEQEKIPHGTPCTHFPVGNHIDLWFTNQKDLPRTGKPVHTFLGFHLVKAANTLVCCHLPISSYIFPTQYSMQLFFNGFFLVQIRSIIF